MKKTLLYLLLSTLFVGVQAQSVTTASSSMQAGSWAVRVPYDVSDNGKEYKFEAGMGGWSWDFFAYQQRNHCGKENLSIARIGCTLAYAEAYSSLPDAVKSTIDTELNNIFQTGVKKVFFLPGIGNVGDQEGDAGGKPTWSTTQRENYVNNIALAADYIISCGYEIFGVAPFNEPDFETTYTGNASNFNAVAAIMQTKPNLAGKIVGPSTLNSTEAKNWYPTVKNNINYANTHQLAGGKWSDYIGFWDTAYSDGKKPVADEMHNVMEAMVCINHGGVAGTWWGWEGISRGEYLRIVNNGTQLAYKERPDEWMVASVNKYKTGNRVEAFIGTSERQAVASDFMFVSKGRLAYYDGHGPYYDYTQKVPGGAKGSYQNGQTNAERLININTGEDVPVEPVNGKYKIVSKVSGKVLSLNGGNIGRGSVYQYEDGALNNQTWDVYPIDSTTVADYSYVVIRNSNTSSIPLYLDAQAWNMDNGADVSVWSDGDALSTPPNGWQRWHLRYVGEGYYHVINHTTGLYMAVLGGGTGNGTNVCEWENDGTDKLLWKFVPADNAVDATAPAKPTGLAAAGQSGAVKLTWNANSDADIYGYMVYRYNSTAGVWECVGRKVKGTAFLDNTCRKGQSLQYKIKAIDGAYNLSEASDVVSATTSGTAAVGLWSGRSLKDSSSNKMDAVANGATFATDNNHASLSFDGTDDYIKLPYHAGDMTNMTFAAWVKMGSTTAGQRIFDFGNGEDEYLYLTPRSSGGKMRFEVKKGGTVQGIDATTALSSGTWTHVAVTIKKSDVKIYVNGSQNATTSSITIIPTNVAPTLCYLGRSQSESDPAFKGLMSDVRLYNYAMTANEISELAKITSNTGSYDITAERIPNIADNVDNWNVTGSWSTWSSTADGSGLSSPYVRIGTSGTSKISKTINYLPAGAYVISASCMSYYKHLWEADVTGVTLFGNGITTTVNTKSNKAAKTLTVTASVGADNVLEFGMNASSTNATILAMDNVTIKYNGPADEFAAGIEDITNTYAGEAAELASKAMNASAKSALKTALQNLNTASENYRDKILSSTATADVANTWIAAIESLKVSMEAARSSVESYMVLGNAIAEAYEAEDMYPQDASIADYGLADIVTKYNNGNYADGEVSSVASNVQNVIIRDYLMGAATPAMPVEITKWFVKSASFEGTTSGWTTTAITGLNQNGLEYWDKNYDIYQILADMPAGEYRFDAKAFYRNGWQGVHYDKYNAGTLAHNAKLYATAGAVTTTANVMPISEDPSAEHAIGNWTTAELYGGNPVPDNMDAAGAAIDAYGKYAPKNGYNSLMFVNPTRGDITIGAKKEVLEGGDWSFYGEVSLWYYGNHVNLDETATIPEVRRTGATVNLKRTIKGTTWNTICLPFAMPASQVKEVFGEEAELRELNRVENAGGGVNLYFNTVYAIEANVPYLMKGAVPGSEFVIKNVDYAPGTAVSEVGGVSFNGVYAPTVMNNAGGTDYYIVSNEIRQSPGTTTIKGFRAFFKTPMVNEVKAMSLFPDGEDATAIEGVMAGGDFVAFPADVYTVSGQIVRKNANGLGGLPRGMYIVGGHKVVVK